MTRQDRRPKFLNVLRIKMPVGAVASIGHRISGLLLFLAIPIASLLLYLTLSGPATFEQARAFLQHPISKIFMFLVVWSLAHHLAAGIRFLLLDLHIGVERAPARRSAWIVNFIGIAVALFYLAGVSL